MDELGLSAVGDGVGISRRGFLKGVVGLGAVVGVSALTGGFWYDDAFAAPPTPPTSTVALPTTTAPEQLLLTWGSDPTSEVTISWAAPGTVPQPAPGLVWSTAPITVTNPGTAVAVPATATPLDVTQTLPGAAAVSFTDTLSLQTTYHYHVQLSGLAPDTTYYYQVTDGSTTVGSSFVTAPSGRVPFRFSSYGDLSTPYAENNATGYLWHESCDNAYYAVSAIEAPGDGGPPPLFHLLNGDLCYANLDFNNQPSVWRDFGSNVARSAANRPWMPALGNHETEFGTDTHDGQPGTAGNGSAGAQGAAGNYWNGPYGYGSYLSRFVLPDNGLVNYDGNHLRGNFYHFQVGTVLFISLDADDVIYQDGGSFYANSTAGSTPETIVASGASIPNGTSTYNRDYTGSLVPDATNNSLVPGGATPNLQTQWLEQTLIAARADSSIDMIVAQMHQCAMSSSSAGNGSDLGIRQAWLPLFDTYGVDLVLSGHEHDYERTYPVRGYDTGQFGTVVAPNPGQTNGAAVDTRRPSVAANQPTVVDGLPAWNTAQGTVFLVLGGGGTNGPTNTSKGAGFYGYNPATNAAQAKVITQRNAIVAVTNGYSKGGADSVEDAPWSAARDTTDSYGYAIFDVDPGAGPGDTTITMRYFHIAQVSNGANPYEGSTSLPSAPYETFVFGRQVPESAPPSALPEFSNQALALGVGVAAAGAAALAVHRRNRHHELDVTDRPL